MFFLKKPSLVATVFTYNTYKFIWNYSCCPKSFVDDRFHQVRIGNKESQYLPTQVPQGTICGSFFGLMLCSYELWNQKIR